MLRLFFIHVYHHQAHFFLGGVCGIHDTAELTAAQYQQAVGYLKQNIKVLSDKEYGDALLLLLIQQIINLV